VNTFSLILAVLALASPGLLAAQEPETPAAGQARPRIGLVLSGGGARGLAHIGVLQELERLRVPVHVITGTSMGAIIGGLYAAGIPADSLAAVARNADWERLLSDARPRDMLDPRRREEGLRYAFEFELGWGRHGPRLPPGLIAGQALSLSLRRLTLPVASVEDFTQLPIPFACVATDLGTGQAVVLGEGDLVRALRASMAIPVVFSPVEIDGRRFVDGGLTNNAPVDLARRMDAEIVIAVDATPPIDPVEEVATLLEVTEQVAAFITRRTTAPQLALADVVITLDMEDFGIFDFSEADSVVARGAAAARAQAAELERWALPPDEYAAWRRGRTPPPLPPRIDEVRVDAPDGIDPRRILGRAGLVPGDSLDPERIERAAELAYGTGEFERVEYDLERFDAGNAAVLRAVPQPFGRDVLRLGARLLTDSGGADLRTGIVTFSGNVAWVRRGWNARGGESRAEVRFGQENALIADWHQPLDFGGRWFVAPSVLASSMRQPLYVEGKIEAEYDVRRLELALDAGAVPGRSTEIRVGFRRAWNDAGTVGTDIALLPPADEKVGAIAASVVIDRLEDVTWPRSGVYAGAELLSARARWGSDREWDRLAVEAAAFGDFGGTTAFVAGGLGSALDTPLPPSEEYRLGGPLSLSGFGPGELRGRYAGAFRGGVYRPLASVPPSSRGIMIGAWIEAGQAWAEPDQVDFDDLAWAATIAAGAETVVGSLLLSYGRAEGGRGRITFGLGLPWAPPFRFRSRAL
jgi:NTE family protein